MIIDAWMQHPNAEWIGNPMFNSLRRWKPGKWSETSQPIEATIAEMDLAGVSTGMLCAWHGPSVRAAGKKSRRLWVKLSAPYRSGGGQAGEVIVRTAYPQLRDAVGLDRLIWGSDWPHTQFEATESYQKARAFLDDLIPDKTERSAILNQNPASLFQFDNSTLSQFRPITPEPPVRTS
jgi:Amidohydrolase